MRRLTIRAGDLEAIRAHAREGAPREVCGVLAGRRDADGATVERVFRAANRHPDPTREYVLDPEEQLRILLHVEDDLGLDVVGFYHSHPAGPARLSETDRARATWADASYVLVWLAPEVGAASWRWDEVARAFEAEELAVEPGGAFYADRVAGVVHRAAAAGPSCAVPGAARVEIADERKATMVLKTRHWRACERCWPTSR